MNRSARHLRLPAVLLAALAIVAAACSPTQSTPPSASQAGPTPGGTLIYGLATKFDTLDPTVTTFSVIGKIGYHVFDPLVWQSTSRIVIGRCGCSVSICSPSPDTHT